MDTREGCKLGNPFLFKCRWSIRVINIVGEKIERKQRASFKILPQMKEIMEYFEVHSGKVDYIFPILNSTNHKTPQQKRARIKTVL